MWNNNKPPLHPSLKGIKYVLFPQHKYLQYWDNTFLCVLIYYCFSIPYTAGVSGGYWMYHYEWWFIVNMILNAFYLGKRVEYCSCVLIVDECHRLTIQPYNLIVFYLPLYFVISFISGYDTVIFQSILQWRWCDCLWITSNCKELCFLWKFLRPFACISSITGENV